VLAGKMTKGNTTSNRSRDGAGSLSLDPDLARLTGKRRYNISDYDIIVMRYIMKKTQSLPDFKAMAELRYQIRRFLRFSENAARQSGIEPQQHQLLLAVRGLPDGVKPTIGALAERMQLQHHSTVELIDRLVGRGFLCRLRATDDRRQVLVKLTHDGENFLKKLSLHHLQELQSAGPKFVEILRGLIEHAEVQASASGESGTTDPETRHKRRKDTSHG
jgi:DNA-binding MarR family transcriptional regulator